MSTSEYLVNMYSYTKWNKAFWAVYINELYFSLYYSFASCAIHYIIFLKCYNCFALLWFILPELLASCSQLYYWSPRNVVFFTNLTRDFTSDIIYLCYLSSSGSMLGDKEREFTKKIAALISALLSFTCGAMAAWNNFQHFQNDSLVRFAFIWNYL